MIKPLAAEQDKISGRQLSTTKIMRQNKTKKATVKLS